MSEKVSKFAVRGVGGWLPGPELPLAGSTEGGAAFSASWSNREGGVLRTPLPPGKKLGEAQLEN